MNTNQIKSMSLVEKLSLISNYEEAVELNHDVLPKLLVLSKDKDDEIRYRVASLLINFDVPKVEKKLISLSRDNDLLVRVEAYDSLSAFHSERVEKRLRKAIFKERHELGIFYAIVAWAEVVNARNSINSFRLKYLEKVESFYKNMNFEYCLLGCYYARFLFGDNNVWKTLLECLKSDNFHVKYVAIDFLKDMMDGSNKDLILSTVKFFYEKEKEIVLKQQYLDFLSAL